MSNVNPYNVFEFELSELIELYKSAKPYYESFKENNIWEYEPIKKCSDEIDLLLNKKHVKRTTNKGYRIGLLYTLRELMFIRLISAFEVYLIDTIKDVFKSNKSLFKTEQKRFNFSQSELLSFEKISELQTKIINSETRKLSSGGYNQITKFYFKRFGINLNSFVDINRIEKYHQIRHLLVHNLGKTDSYFRKKYKYEKKGVSITEKLLFTAINDIRDLASKTWKEISKLEIKHENKIIDFELVQINFQKLSDSKIDFIENNFQFYVLDELRSFGELNTSIQYKQNGEIFLELNENRATIKEFVKIIKNKIKRSKDLKGFNIKRIKKTRN